VSEAGRGGGLAPLRRASSVLALIAFAGCTHSPFSAPTAFSMEGARTLREVGPGVVRVRWVKELVPPDVGPYLPVEGAGAALDAAHDRIYQGTSRGILYAFDSAGALELRYDAGEALEATPAVDPAHQVIYVPAVDGTIHALDTATFELKWKEDLGFAVRKPVLLTDDALYLVTETNQVSALSREDGTVLWSYRRPAGEEFSVAGQAGLTLHEGRIYTGFSDGVVVALDASDGGVVWEIDTSEDVGEIEANRPTFADIDTTPVVADGHVYVASYAAGLYELALGNGSVEWRDPERKGVVAMADAGPWLIMLSSREGVVALDRTSREVQWRRPIERGAPTSARVLADRGLLLYGESQGALLAVTVREGRELARLESGHGFNATPSILGDLGAVLSNAGTLYVFRMPAEVY
jgi:outer membrane protein assembly factor BamB